jgi:hypothetical protein
MVVNDIAYFLVLRGVLAFIASKLAPTVDPYWSHMACPLKTHCGSEPARDEASRCNESLCLLNFFLQSQPARSCVKDYDYFRIRRLVRLFGGFYLLRVAAHQRSGLVARIFQAHDYTFGRFFRLCFYGGHAWGAFERAGSLDRSTNLRMAATFRLVAKVMAPYLQENHQC